MINLKIERVKKGLTQHEFADELDVSLESIRAWEQGRIIPSGEMLIKLSNRLGVTIDYLLKEVIVDEQTKKTIY